MSEKNTMEIYNSPMLNSSLFSQEFMTSVTSGTEALTETGNQVALDISSNRNEEGNESWNVNVMSPGIIGPDGPGIIN